MKKNFLFTFILCGFIICADLGTSFQRQKPERMEKTKWQSRV